MTLHEKHQVTRKGPSKYTWEYELRWYHSHFYWFHFLFLVVLPVPIYIVSQYVSLTRKTFWLAVSLHFVGGWCITGGYHRLFAHGSYRAKPFLRLFIAIVGAGEMQWSILWWVYHHRAHHRYTDTGRDPYDARRGFLFCHIGWLLGYNPIAWGDVDISDIKSDRIVVWQQKYYVLLAVIAGVLLPMAIAHYGWNDWLGGAVYASGYRITFTLHTTFLVNSLSHAPWAGSQPYSSANTSRNVPLVALITGGEGSHNFHHTFPNDYRHGTNWIDLDYTKVVIWVLYKVGLVSSLKTVSNSEIERARRLQEGHQVGDDALDVSGLPGMSWTEFVEATTYGRCLVVINGIVNDVSQFMADHPGGRHLLQASVGKDATEIFYAGDHYHSPHAEAVLERLQIAVISKSS
ncbi:hypothetical protein ETB97_008992 [Aspergillus alliaceus]|uniref:Acyl-CoA desaturase n=1 Tax=Petromyces alliaceus TaxID=209559 RepID=A0A8H6E167_PETAA|nr:hypothetical protein ETB97_008992 [Aspergillus burnettii]